MKTFQPYSTFVDPGWKKTGPTTNMDKFYGDTPLFLEIGSFYNSPRVKQFSNPFRQFSDI